MIEISVVIATRNRAELLYRCLTALLGQTLPLERFEVIVIDDGPSEATRQAVQQIAERGRGRMTLRYRKSKGTRGPAGARNVGWRASTAELIAFTDDDTVPDADWLAEGCFAMQGRAAAVSGRTSVPCRGRPTDHARNTLGLEAAEFVTANAFVRRSALEAVGGFDERFTRAWREDSDLHFSLIERFGPIGRAPKAVVLHPVRPAAWGVSIGQQANVCFDALLYRKHPALYRERIRHRPPWLYLLIVACAGSALGLALGGAYLAAGLCAAVSVGAVLAFAQRRLRGASLAPAHVAEMLCTSFMIPFASLFWRLVGSVRFRVLFP